MLKQILDSLVVAVDLQIWTVFPLYLSPRRDSRAAFQREKSRRLESFFDFRAEFLKPHSSSRGHKVG